MGKLENHYKAEVKELNRKDKALAEMAVLVTLKKTQHHIGGARGRLIAPELRVVAVELIEKAGDAEP